MKSKIVNLTLIGALMLGSASTFVSCKDTNSDEISVLQSQIDGLQSDLLNQVAALQAQDEALRRGYETLYTDLSTKLGDLTNTVNGIKSCVCTGIPAQSELPEFLRNVNSIDQLADKLLETGKFDVTVPGGETTPSVSEDEVKAWIAAAIADKGFTTDSEVTEKLNSALSAYLLITDYKQQIEKLEKAIDDTKELANKAQVAADAAQTAADAAQTAADGAQTTANEALAKANEALETYNGLTAEEVQTLIDNAINNISYQAILDRIEALEKAQGNGGNGNTGNSDGCICPDWASSIAQLTEDVRNALVMVEQAKTDAAAALEAATLNDASKDYVDSVANAAKTAILAELNAKLDDYITKDDLNGYLSNYVTTSGLNNTVNTINNTIAEMQNKYDEKFDSLQTAINELYDKYDLVIKKYDTMVSGVIVQKVTNPVLGTVTLPGYSSSILAAYYGTTDSKVQFPTKNVNYFANSDDKEYFSGVTLTKQLEIASDQTIVQNPGNVYVTVNPNDVDASGIQVSLVNSKGEEAAGFKLGSLTKSDELLTFGYTRADETGFYVSKADITDVNAVKKISINKSQIQSSAQSVLSDLKSGSYFSSAKGLASIAATLLSGVNNQLPAYAVRAKWNDGEKDRTVTSNYSIAATAVPALGYAFGQSLSINATLPTIPTLETLMEKMGISINGDKFGLTQEEYNNLFGDGIVIDVPLNMVFDVTIDATNVNPVVEIKKENITITVNSSASIDSDKVHGEIIDNENGTQSVKITIDQDAIEANASVEDVQITPNVSIPFENIKIILEEADAVDESKSQFILNKTVKVQLTGAQLQSIISCEQINEIITNKIGSISSLASAFDNSTFRTKFNNFMTKIQKLIKSPNKFLQPALFYSDDSSLGQVSASAAAPSVINLNGGTAEAVLYASSYTGEIIVPAYKKYVAVYKKQSDGTWAAYDAANSAAYNTGVVIDGNVVAVGFKVSEAGLYRIVYQGLDYAGKVAGRSYYIQVK